MAPASDPLADEALLQAVTELLESHRAVVPGRELFQTLLDRLLALTNSEYGFVGEVIHDGRGRPCLKSWATTNIAWNEETQRLYAQAEERGMIFSRLDSLYGAVLTTGHLILSNDPAHDSRSCGLPPGHPPLESFMGIPFHGRDGLLGMAGLANRPGGYDAELALRLRPFLAAAGKLLQERTDHRRLEALEADLARCRARQPSGDGWIELGGGYRFDPAALRLEHQGQPVVLARKELALLLLLAEHLGEVVPYARIEERIWPQVVVGPDSLRSLLRRLRRRAPELPIRTVRGVGVMLAPQVRE